MAAAPPLFVPCAAGVYALQANGGDAIYGWVGYVLSPADNPPSGQPIATNDAFNSYKGSYVFAAGEPTAGLAALQANVQTFLGGIASVPIRALIWLPDPALTDPLPADSTRYAIAFRPMPPGNFLQLVQDFSAWLGPDNGFTFSVKNRSSVGWDSTSQSITFSGISGNTAGFLYGTNKVWSPTPGPSNAGLVVQDGPLGATVVPLAGNRAGAFGATVEMEPAVTFPLLQPGLAYWANNAGTDVPSRFPLIDASDIPASTTVTLAAAIDPLDLMNRNLPAEGPVTLNGGQIRTGFALTGAAPTWTSFLRNLDGRPALLTPYSASSPGPYDGPPDFAGGFAFMAQQSWDSPPPPGKGFAFTPSGDWGVSIEGFAPATAGQTLLPGLFGSERFNFTTWDPADPNSGSRLRFLVSQAAYAPVFPFPDASIADPQSGKVASARLTGTYQTAWASIVGPSPLFQAEPDGGAYYGGVPPAEGAPLLASAPPATAVPQEAGFCVPIAPYAAYVPDPGWGDPAAVPGIVSAFESQILSATRKAQFGGAGSKARAERAARLTARLTADADAAGDWTTTRQGLLAEVSAEQGATDLLEIVFAQYQPRGTPAPPLAPFGITGPTEIVQEALQTSQLFVAAVNPAPLAVFSPTLDIADWAFDVEVGQDQQATDYTNVLILKYCDGPLIDWVRNPNKWTDAPDFSLLPDTDPSIGYTGLSSWLAGYIQDAIDKGQGTGPYAGKPNPLYANIAQIATQADWKGFLALKASLPDTALPPQIEGLAAGIDPKRFFAHHFGATLSRVKPNPDTGAAQTLIIDGVSSLFGLIDYQDPLYVAALAAGSDPDTPLLIDAADDYDFRVLNLQALFVNARMTSFQSRIQITLNRFFGAPVKTTQRADPSSPGQWLVQPGNGVVLDGSAVNQNGTTTYVFQQSKPTLFTFDTPALNAITISRVQFNTLGVAPYTWPSGPADTITSRFLFWGTFDFPLIEGTDGTGYDIFSFGSGAETPLGQGLAYSNLQLTMRSAESTPTVTAFDFDPSNIAFDLGGSALRAGSLFTSLALQLQSFILAPAGKSPLDYGFLTAAPEGLEVGALGDGWCGIVHKVNMGGPGALVSAAGFSSELLVAWSPVPGPSPAAFIGLKLPGTAPGASAFSLQGVFKITTGPIILQRAAPSTGQPLPNFSIKLSNVGATFLGIKKIPDATIQFFLFGDPQGTGSLGWYASWNESNNAGGTTAPLALPGGTQ